MQQCYGYLGVILGSIQLFPLSIKDNDFMAPAPHLTHPCRESSFYSYNSASAPCQNLELTLKIMFSFTYLLALCNKVNDQLYTA